MRDKELTLEVLSQIEEAATKIVDRFRAIHERVLLMSLSTPNLNDRKFFLRSF